MWDIPKIIMTNTLTIKLQFLKPATLDYTSFKITANTKKEIN